MEGHEWEWDGAVGASVQLDGVPCLDDVGECGLEVEGDLARHGVGVGKGVDDRHGVFGVVVLFV